MDFIYKGRTYFVHRYTKDYYGTANYVYLKDGELVFVDCINVDVFLTLKLFIKTMDLKNNSCK